MIKLTDQQADKAKSVLKDIMICAGILPNTRSSKYAEQTTLLNDSSYKTKGIKPGVKAIANNILRRDFNFSEVDNTLKAIRENRIIFGNTPDSEEAAWAVNRPETLPRFIAWCCATNRIYWDDTIYTVEERRDIITKSAFAYALYEAECFVSQPIRVKKPVSAGADGTSVSADTTPTAAPEVDSTATPAPKVDAVGDSVAAAAPADTATPADTDDVKGGYKSAGPQSAYVAGLISKPGEKIKISSPYVYSILADKLGANQPKAFIHPVDNPKVGEKAKVNSKGLPVIKFGSGNGYTDLAIFSETREGLEGIFEALKARGVFDKYTHSRIASVANKGEYYKVNTELGEVLIRTTKLNEKLITETIEEMYDDGSENIIIEEGVSSTEVDDTLQEEQIPEIYDIKQFARDMALYD